MEISSSEDGAMSAATGVIEARFQFDCWATTRSAARTLAKALSDCLDYYHGSDASTQIDWIRFLMQEGIYDDEAELHRFTQDYLISYRNL